MKIALVGETRFNNLLLFLSGLHVVFVAPIEGLTLDVINLRCVLCTMDMICYP